MATVRSLRGAGTVLRVGATPVPHAEILDHVRDDLARVDVDLHIEVFETFDEPNRALVRKNIDANFFQYLPFLQEFNRSTGNDLVAVTAVHIEPFALYSQSIDTIDAIPEYAEVALPGDPVNAARALRILHDQHLITLEHDEMRTPTIESIADNPRQLLFKQIASAHLTDVLNDFDVVFLFGNYAMDRQIDLTSALHCDTANPDFAEYLVARPDNADSRPISLLASALNSDAVRTFLSRAYGTRVAAAF
ncbi:metal ABC transporter substrate-binding protein [Mycobacteroides franklinii]|uniref:Metal ABC transporter substrate-binding protein n=1 Tax=Mycobacteroides franklinii TaxID=948102 RepID=A0A1S1L597_9MYCO|nr:MetQ/NlpA family ABC transporter substrate-binding protein [Mycobacteroides franklinii]OHU22289.1 metal ABC transporter substrate-binding protein [Mycobacteroides franklinii]